MCSPSSKNTNLEIGKFPSNNSDIYMVRTGYLIVHNAISHMLNNTQFSKLLQCINFHVNIIIIIINYNVGNDTIVCTTI